MWVLDWYNFIVQHNPTPAGLQDRQGQRLRDRLRDKKHGRVYRLVYTKAKPEPKVDLQGRDAGEAGRDAEAPQHALAAARPAAAGGAAASETWCRTLAELVEDKTVDETGLNVGRDPRRSGRCRAWASPTARTSTRRGSAPRAAAPVRGRPAGGGPGRPGRRAIGTGLLDHGESPTTPTRRSGLAALLLAELPAVRPGRRARSRLTPLPGRPAAAIATRRPRSRRRPMAAAAHAGTSSALPGSASRRAGRRRRPREVVETVARHYAARGPAEDRASRSLASAARHSRPADRDAVIVGPGRRAGRRTRRPT